MKRLLSVLALILLLAACNSESRNPAIKGYRLSQAGGLGFGLDGVTAALTLDLDVENPSRSTYSLEALEATIYRGLETEPFASPSAPGARQPFRSRSTPGSRGPLPCWAADSARILPTTRPTWTWSCARVPSKNGLPCNVCLSNRSGA